MILGFELGMVNLEAEIDLSQVRNLIYRLLHEHPMLPYEPGKEWRFLDCKILCIKIFVIFRRFQFQ